MLWLFLLRESDTEASKIFRAGGQEISQNRAERSQRLHLRGNIYTWSTTHNDNIHGRNQGSTAGPHSPAKMGLARPKLCTPSPSATVLAPGYAIRLTAVHCPILLHSRLINLFARQCLLKKALATRPEPSNGPPGFVCIFPPPQAVASLASVLHYLFGLCVSLIACLFLCLELFLTSNWCLFFHPSLLVVFGTSVDLYRSRGWCYDILISQR